MYLDSISQNNANTQPLTPVRFLQRNATARPGRTAIVHGDRQYSWSEYYERCVKLAHALRAFTKGELVTVAVMAPNVPAMLEAHFGVPLAGAVLCCINYRLDSAAIALILQHAEVKVLLVDTEFSTLAREAVDSLEAGQKPIVIDIEDNPSFGDGIGITSYETMLAQAASDGLPLDPRDEFHPISVNYTSGTTGNPKGVIYHYRGAYLSALGNALTFGLDRSSMLLWTLPLFHCNGWSQAWAMAAAGGTHICLRKVESGAILRAISDYSVTHMSAAPIVLNSLEAECKQTGFSIEHQVEVATGGAPPPSSTIASMEALGFRITHLYGLTESFGPSLTCERQSEWDVLDQDDLASRLARQGVRLVTDTDVSVRDSDTLAQVPRDGKTVGEIMIRSNGLMAGYLKNPDATKEAFLGGWFHTGDLAVVEKDGFIRITDRMKDVIISGGENISSVELEEVLYSHPMIIEAAVVAQPDAKWGESPCAFVSLKSDAQGVDSQEIIDWCRERLASFKVPKRFVFCDLPKTATGKIQKFRLREIAKVTS